MSSVALRPGDRFGDDFRVTRVLGEGGMGAVYVVEQLSTGRSRALKLMRPELLKEERARELFEQEARVGARIASEHVVEVIGAGVDEASGLPWLAMELLDGEDLETLMQRRGRLPPGETRELFEQLCHGLGAAHQAGLVHRDLKPQNLFIAKARRLGVPFTLKILDFGIAKLVQQSTASSDTTRPVGSPRWMAPEQTSPSRLIRPATDVWALGLIAYFLLTGQSYWKALQTPGAPLTALLFEMLMEPLEPASLRAQSVGQQLPAGFDDWFARCVVRDTAARFADADQAFAALAPILGGVARVPERPALPVAQGASLDLGNQSTLSGPTTPPAAPGGPVPPVAATTGAKIPGDSLAPAAFTLPPGAAPRPGRRAGWLVAVGIAGLTLTSLAGRQWLRQRAPAAPPRPLPVSDFNLGREHSCARLLDGTVRCWGSNAAGQLGDGSLVNRRQPARVKGLPGVVQLDVGAEHSCARLADGSVHCWGRNGSGQLGDGTTSDRRGPVKVVGLEAAAQIALGGKHSCARLVDGTVRCWGGNGFGQVGSGQAGGVQPRPLRVIGLEGVTQLATAGGSSCALTAEGRAFCWGWNGAGQLGDGTTENRAAPVPVVEHGSLVQLSLGGDLERGGHACSISGGATVHCWGWNTYGQLGDGSTSNRSRPTPVAGLANVVQVQAGGEHTCIRTGRGELLCWGGNSAGQLGIAQLQTRPTPVAVPGLPGRMLSLAAGGKHSCALASDSSLLCWGENLSGQLGDGTTTPRDRPVTVLE